MVVFLSLFRGKKSADLKLFEERVLLSLVDSVFSFFAVDLGVFCVYSFETSVENEFGIALFVVKAVLVLK